MTRTQLAAQVVWHPSRALLCRAIIALLLIACAPLALAQSAEEVPAEETPTEVPAPLQVEAEPQPTLIMRELLVLQTDRYGDTANNPQLIATTLPAGVNKTGRDKSLGDQPDQYDFSPMPLGIITFEGVIQEPMQLRVELASSNSRIQAFWPKDGIVGNRLAIWQAVRQADDQQRVVDFGNQGEWLSALRKSDDRVWLQSRDKLQKERFFFYDASIRFKPVIDVAFANDQYSLKTNEPTQVDPLLSVLLRKSEDGWHADSVTAPWAQPNPPIAQKTSETAAVPSLNEALGPVTDLLTQRGYNAQEIELALGMIAAAGFETSTFSLVYVMSDKVIDRHIRLQVKPAPDQVIRTAIVVVNNVDPDLGSRVNALLDDLGNDQWLKRDRAQRELINLGQAAIKKVQQLKDHKDPEVAFRARQILDAHDWKMSGGK